VTKTNLTMRFLFIASLIVGLSSAIKEGPSTRGQKSRRAKGGKGKKGKYTLAGDTTDYSRNSAGGSSSGTTNKQDYILSPDSIEPDTDLSRFGAFGGASTSSGTTNKQDYILSRDSTGPDADFSRFAFGGSNAPNRGNGGRIPDNTNFIFELIQARETSPDVEALDSAVFFSPVESSTIPSSSPSQTPSQEIVAEAREEAPATESSVSDRPSLVPSMQPNNKETSPSAISSDWPSLVPSMQPSSVVSPQEAAPTTKDWLIKTEDSFGAFGKLSTPVSDRPSLVPSYSPSAVVPSDAPSSVPSTVPSDAPSAVPSEATIIVSSIAASVVPTAFPSAIPSDYPSVVPTSYQETSTGQPSSPSFSFPRLTSPGFVSCTGDPAMSIFGEAPMDSSSLVDITVMYWYDLQVEVEYEASVAATSQVVDSIEAAILESVQDSLCATSRRRLQVTEIAGFSSDPPDIRISSCGIGCYPVFGGMKVKVEQSVAVDADKYGSLYCGVLQVIHDTIGSSVLSDLEGVESIAFVNNPGPYTCDTIGPDGNVIPGSTKGPEGGGNEGGGANEGDASIPLVATMSFILAGGMIAFAALFTYAQRERYRHDNEDRTVNDLDTTLQDGTAIVEVRTGIDPITSQPLAMSPMSGYFTESVYTDNADDDGLLMANSSESWTGAGMMGDSAVSAIVKADKSEVMLDTL